MKNSAIEGFGNRLRAFRTRRGLSQDALATIVDAQPAAISRYERGLSHPNASTLAAIAIALDVSVSRLLLDGEHAGAVAAAAAIADPTLLDCFRRADQLTPRDRDVVIRVVDALIAGMEGIDATDVGTGADRISHESGRTAPRTASTTPGRADSAWR